jgi:hypothetical protein
MGVGETLPRGSSAGILKGLAFECLEYAKIAVSETSQPPTRSPDLNRPLLDQNTTLLHHHYVPCTPPIVVT